MPQMNPMNWNLIFTLNLISLIMMITLIFFSLKKKSLIKMYNFKNKMYYNKLKW